MNIPTITIIGSVDNGKSTLIGSLLIQTQSVSPGIIEKTEKFCAAEGINFEPAYLVDYIREEREMKSTREWALAELKFGADKILIIDTPGQMTLSKKMISGLTQANMTALILDITEENYARYNYYFSLLSFLNIKNYVVLINKVDLINYDETKYNAYLKKLKENVKFDADARVIPVSALQGDNITEKSANTPWFAGAPLGDYLKDFINYEKQETSTETIFPIQDIITKDDKIIALGKLLSGKIKKNDKLELFGTETSQEVTCVELYHLDKTVEELLEGENGAIEINSTTPNKNELLTNAKNNFEHLAEISARLYIIEPFDFKNKNLSIRYLKFKMNIKDINTTAHYNWQFEKINLSESLNTNEFVDVKITLSQKYPFASKNIQTDIPETKQIAIETQNGELMSVGIITELI